MTSTLELNKEVKDDFPKVIETERDLSHLPTGWYLPGVEFPDEAPELEEDEQRLSAQVASGDLLRLLRKRVAEVKLERARQGGAKQV